MIYYIHCCLQNMLFHSPLFKGLSCVSTESYPNPTTISCRLACIDAYMLHACLFACVCVCCVRACVRVCAAYVCACVRVCVCVCVCAMK